ncbi:ANTAR domain-containing protein [Cellulomonas sp. URHB0016]
MLDLGETVEDALEDFVLHAAYHLGTHIECSISVRHSGEGRRVASSGPRAARCDEVEYERRSGPCVTAMDTLGVVLVPDIAADERWTDWRTVALEEGFRSAAAFAVHVGPRAEVALNVYSDLVDPWDTDRIVRTDVYAQQIGLVLTWALRVEKLQDEERLVADALQAQAEIDRAVGAAMAVHNLSAAEALAMLRRESARDDLPLPEVAHRVLRELRLPPA